MSKKKKNAVSWEQYSQAEQEYLNFLVEYRKRVKDNKKALQKLKKAK